MGDARAEEYARLERGLLPRPLLTSDGIGCTVLYEPGGDGAVLGGDFFDVVELDDGRVRAMIGDVAGHGPDEAALGVRLRAGWRALALAGVPSVKALAVLQDLLVVERHDPSVFATICDLEIAVDSGRCSVALAGHPAPLLCADGGVHHLPAGAGPPLGVLDEPAFERFSVELGHSWSLLCYTDGLVENVVDLDGVRARIGDEGLVELVAAGLRRGRQPAELVQGTLAGLLAGAASCRADDVAIVTLTSPPWHP